jgi:hypothetical protein
MLIKYISIIILLLVLVLLSNGDQLQPAPNNNILNNVNLNQNLQNVQNKIQQQSLNQENILPINEVQVPKREAYIKRSQTAVLYYSKECQDDIARYCPNGQNTELSDLAVLRCIHNQVADFSLIDKQCHNVFNFKKFIIIKLIVNNFLFLVVV